MPPITELEQPFCNPAIPDGEIAPRLMETYAARLFRLANAVLRDPDEAEDAVQQTLVRALLHRESYAPTASLSAWLFTIQMNVCRGMLRKRRSRQAWVRLLGLEEDPPDPAASPEPAYLVKEASQELWRAVDQLPEKLGWAVHLRFEQGLAVAEIAQVLHISEKAVYSRLYEAFRLLKSKAKR